MEVALEHCHKNLGDDATILFEYGLPTATFEAIVKEQGKMLGGPCYEAGKYFGREADPPCGGSDRWNSPFRNGDKGKNTFGNYTR